MGTDGNFWSCSKCLWDISVERSEGKGQSAKRNGCKGHLDCQPESSSSPRLWTNEVLFDCRLSRTEGESRLPGDPRPPRAAWPAGLHGTRGTIS